MYPSSIAAASMTPFLPEEHVWKDWRARFISYIEAVEAKGSKRKLALLKFVGGKEINRLLTVLPSSVVPGVGLSVSLLHTDVYLEALSRLDDHFAEMKNIRLERSEFGALKQASSETARAFIVRLREKAERCEFTNLEERVQEAFIQGTNDEKVKRSAVRHEMSLQQLVNEATLNETMKQNNEKGDVVQRIETESKPVSQSMACYFCKKGGHLIGKCPSLTNICCYSCVQQGHTAARCSRYAKPISRKNSKESRFSPYSKSGANGQQENSAARGGLNTKPVSRENSKEGRSNPVDKSRKESVRSIEELSDEDEAPLEYLFFIEGSKFVECKIGGVNQRMVVDSGSRCNLIPKPIWELLKARKIRSLMMTTQSDRKFVGYGGESLKVAGMFHAKIELGTKKADARFYVMESGKECLLGIETAVALGAISFSKEIVSDP